MNKREPCPSNSLHLHPNLDMACFINAPSSAPVQLAADGAFGGERSWRLFLGRRRAALPGRVRQDDEGLGSPSGAKSEVLLNNFLFFGYSRHTVSFTVRSTTR